MAALGSRVLGYDPYVAADAELPNVEVTGLDELLAAADFLTLHVPMTPETRRMIGARELGLMKPTACIVNVSRGDLIDEDALVDALAANGLAGVALDVTALEPTPADHPLLNFSNVVVTPHVAFYSDASLQDVKHRIALYVMNALRGEGEFVAAARV
jgi:phosphoglycerate dehydrogenase-like enzyme